MGRARPGISAQQRRAERRIALLTAARDLLGTQDRTNLTVAEVCRRAGVTETQFLEHFADLDSLVQAASDVDAFPDELANQLRRRDRKDT